MIKKILATFFVLYLNFFINSTAFSDPILVENIFTDVNKNYKYYNELQTLYNKWIILPDKNWKLNPYDLLNRDEFIWITSEISCKKCIQPNTDTVFLNKYTKKPFFDISKSNKYFYCISDAKSNNFIKWYDINYICTDKTFGSWKRPFCSKNTIILEEALAIIMRMSWLLTNAEANKIRNEIVKWNITEQLSLDVGPKNLDGSVYSFYPDFQKALEYKFVEYDINWKKTTYNLIKKKDNKLRPKKSITKEEFLHIAYIVLKVNSCIWNNNNNFVVEKKCWYDSDNDWIDDCRDLCNWIKWEENNNGCPIFEFKCKKNDFCPDGYECKKWELNICVPIVLEKTCEYSGGSIFFWNVIVNTCPSDISLNFRSSIRKCDEIFPAIVSPNNTTIYSRWEMFEVE